MKRVRRLLYPEGPVGAWAPAMAALVVLLSSSALFAAWRMAPVAQAAEARPAAAQSESGWQKWLNEDAVYIISDEERAAFERLTTDEERRHFVEQFWERRNPNPGSAENKFKQEHYRRIAFANRRFGTKAGRPGWQTDRGHIYIVYGPPDEIEAHPKTGDKYAVQAWRYRNAEVFSFVDRTGNGEYQLGR